MGSQVRGDPSLAQCGSIGTKVEPGPTRVTDAIRQLTRRVAEVDDARVRCERLAEINVASQECSSKTHARARSNSG